MGRVNGRRIGEMCLLGRDGSLSRVVSGLVIFLDDQLGYA